MRLRSELLVMLALTSLAGGGCSRRSAPDAYGNVEATETVVGAEAAGRVISYSVIEGQKLTAGTVVGAIDSTQMGLERDLLAAQRDAAASRIDEIRRQAQSLEAQQRVTGAQREAARAQREALAAQQEIAGRAYERAKRLFAEQAATAQQLDQAERDYRVLGDQIKAQDEQIRAHERQIDVQGEQVRAAHAQETTARHQVTAADAQVGVASERLRKTQITNPLAGTVLTTYARLGEIVQIGQPLYKVASLDAVDVRAYVTEPQLATLRLGQSANVTIDAGGTVRRTMAGTLTWISSQAEFTPTPIQTRDERADLVYALKIRVPNPNGTLKIGMPADVAFGVPTEGTAPR